MKTTAHPKARTRAARSAVWDVLFTGFLVVASAAIVGCRVEARLESKPPAQTVLRRVHFVSCSCGTCENGRTRSFDATVNGSLRHFKADGKWPDCQSWNGSTFWTLTLTGDEYYDFVSATAESQ